MATGKGRGSKRSSGVSYSTMTTVIFVALCVLGVWVLNSNSFSPPKSTTRSASTTSPLIHSDSISKPSNKKIHPIHIDSSSVHLPGDAIRTDELSRSDDSNESKIPEDTKDLLSDPSEVSMENADEAAGENSFKQETEENIIIDNDNKIESEHDNIDEKKENENVKDQDSVVEETREKLQGEESVEEKENQNALNTQTSEESSVTQNQQVEETTKENPLVSTHEESQQTENGKHTTGKHDVEEITENVISDEDRQQRIDEHQKQEDEQVQQGQKEGQSQEDTTTGITSDDQIQHDEAHISSAEDDPTLKDAKEIDTKVKNQEDKATLTHEMNPKKLSKKNEGDSFPNGENTGIPKESKESEKAWSTQADQSEYQKERRKGGPDDKDSSIYGYTWKLCNVTAGTDYIPCLDNEKAIAKLQSRKHYEHRERHCPEESPTCLVPLPRGYKSPIEWPQSRDKIWYHNVPHPMLAEVKGHQNWVKVTGEFLTFPGGGTQFIHGALHYIDFVQEAVPDIAWGKHTRVVLDVGCGVASFGGFLFDRDVLAISFAPKDEHEAQVQFALERGIPAISAVMGSKRLPFPSRVFDVVHCARCRVPWHADGGSLLLELNRVLRPGGYFVWSATPVYQTLEEDVEIWKEMSNLTVSMCWELVTIKKDKLNSIGAAIYHKPDSNDCYDQRKQNHPPMCKTDDDPNAAWHVPLQSCMHRVPIEGNERGSQWPEEWPERAQTPPYWLNRSQMGIYGKPAPEDFASDYEHWKKVVSKTYMSGMGISWSNVRNVMDMRAVYGGFAAALKDLKVWVMNVVNIDSPDTLPIIYERGLFGIYHDWCESFSTYPRTYDLLHADHLFSKLKKR
ncbi:putative methyltransferase PMT27 [Forsythia ovata]|uniref:Methyltransferase PMT27 n=1 Tax=Forsythia ovata TaxID=205694 RepID=A0ABD1U684_9LAMI